VKTVIVYYSFSGNTNRVAHAISNCLKQKGDDVTLVKLTPLHEEKNFIMQCNTAFLGKKAELFKTLTDLSGFDRVIIGSPVWAFKPVPAVNSYLDTCTGASGKKAACFVTSGGMGAGKALLIMQKALEQKGAAVEACFSFIQNEKDEKVAEEIAAKLGNFTN